MLRQGASLLRGDDSVGLVKAGAKGVAAAPVARATQQCAARARYGVGRPPPFLHEPLLDVHAKQQADRPEAAEEAGKYGDEGRDPDVV